MEHTEERPEHQEASEGNGQEDGAKRKRRRRRGKRRPDGSAAGPADGAANDGATDEAGDTADGDAADGDAASAGEDTADGQPRQKKRRRKKKRGAQADGTANGDIAEEAVAPGADVPAAPRQGRPQQPSQRPAGGQPQGQPQGQPRQAQAQQPNQGKQEKRNGRDRRRDKERREQERQQQMLGRIVKTELLRDDATAEPYIPKPKQVATSVDGYIGQYKGWQREALMRLREIIVAAGPDLAEDIKWAQPVYEFQGPVCYIKAFSDHINVGFWRGTELRDADGLLVGDSMKMRHITIRNVNEIKRDVLESLVKQAVKLNREKGDPTL